MKATEITEENLEDLLTYDDIFMEYFNAFMALPAFPQALQYNRLTGTFQEVEGTQNSIAGSVILPDTMPYGVTDEERESMLEWCKTERLPCFLRTDVFRELKLCKLLLRTLDDRYSASRVSSRAIRGYSRASESYVSSLSNSVDNSANEDESDYDEDGIWADYDKSALYKYNRPGSRALSLPPKLGLAEFAMSMSDSRGEHSHKKASSASNKNREDSRLSSKVPGVGDDVVSDSGVGTSVLTGAENTFLRSEPTFNTRHETLLSIQENRVSDVVQSDSNNNSKSRRSTKTSENSLRRRFQHKRAVSAPINYNEFLRIPTQYSDFDVIFGEEEPRDNGGQAYVEFGDEMISEQQTESDLRQLEGKHHMSMEEMKEKLLSSLSGFEAFKNFLQGTNGESLLNFWLDCERFKDDEMNKDVDNASNQLARNQLFRDIQDKYKMSLTEDAKKQISKISSDTGVSNTVYIRTQYDVLRRLRSYWLPRFVVHMEHVGQLRQKLPEVNTARSLPPVKDNSSFLPSISLVNSMPVQPEDVLLIATTKSWEMVSKGGRKLDERVKSARPWQLKQQQVSPVTIRDKIGVALWYDKVAGGPFQQYLQRDKLVSLLSNLLFWQDVTEYGVSQSRDSDRLLRLTRAWNIFNRFVAIGSMHNIGIDPKDRERTHNILLNSKDFVDATLFDVAKEHAVDLLEKAWIRFLKEDMKKFLDCHVWRDEDESPPSTADDIEVVVMREKVIVRRPWVKKDQAPDRYPPSTCSERARRLKTALTMAESIDDSKRAEQKKKRQERRKAIEKERKKAVRNAYRRQREAKKAKLKSSKNDDPDGGHEEDGEGEASGKEAEPEAETIQNTPRSARSKPGSISPIIEEDKPVTYVAQKDNKPMISLFKKYLNEHESKESLHVIAMYADIDSYNQTTQKQKKDIQATFIHKTYFDTNSKKSVKLSDRLYTKLSSEKDRPRSPTLHDAQKYITSQLNTLFQEFWKIQAEEFGVDEKTLGQMSQAELSMRGESDASLMKSFGGKGKSGAKGNLKKPQDPTINPFIQDELASVPSLSVTFALPRVVKQVVAPTYKQRKKVTGRAQPTKEDKQTFLTSLSEASGGKPPLQMLYFYKYLVKHGEDDGFPNIDKDLFFYIEVQKFKGLSHAHANEDLVRLKCQALLDCFMDCASSPACQIDVATDMSLRTVRNVQRVIQGKEPLTSTLFDEPQYMVFKELLPYWAGFARGYKTPEDLSKVPVTKHQRLLRKRLDEFNSMPAPNRNFQLPALTMPGAKVAAFTFTINEGISIRDPSKESTFEESLEEPSSDTPVAETPESVRRASFLGGRRGRGATTLAEIKEAA